ncbi:HET-domain-containing protein [Cadophora sp. DSE1049]|nr:HET-domain-containing protein [Cadophora sp. DSE1049]
MESSGGDTRSLETLSNTDETCPLVSRQEQDTDGYVPIDHLVGHAETGCGKCCLLRVIHDGFQNRTGWFYSESDWRTLRFRNSAAKTFAVDVFIPQGHPKLFGELKHRPAIGEIPHEESIARAKSWISRCDKTHRSCQSAAEPRLPRRVLEISADKVRLIETNGQFNHYIALSHCWGDSRPPCLTTKVNLDANMDEISWESLPKTFQDSILVCREMNIRYLWIDSICIIQDDDIDWMQESAKMASVYHGSYLTICATSALSDDVGLWTAFSEGAPVKKLIVKIESQDFQIYLRTRDDVRAVHLDCKFSTALRPRTHALNPLLSRGWTFQEGLISPRLLQFGYGELLWQCPEQQICECSDEQVGNSSYMLSCERERHLFRSLLSDGLNTVDTWQLLVQEYSGLRHTFHKDVLPALSGVAKMYLEKRPGDRYLAGLWEQTLVQDLAWTPLDNPERQPRLNVYRAPSWSWASITQQVLFFATANTDAICARVLHANTVLAGLDPTGEVLSGSIVLVAPVEPAKITLVHPLFFYVDSDNSNHDIMFSRDTNTDIDDNTSRGRAVLCLRLYGKGRQSGYSRINLALVAVDGQPGVYRRIGIGMVFPSQDFSEGSFKQEMEVEII